MNPDRLISTAALTRAGEFANRHKLLVLSYHGVEDDQRFAEQLRWLRTRRRPISLADLESSVRSGNAIETPSFLVTFDDGRRSVLERGVPVLESLEIPAALFVVAGLVGTDEPFWWDEAERLSSAGGTTSVSADSGAMLVRHLKRVPDDERRAALVELRTSAGVPRPTYPHLTPDELLELEQRGVAVGSHSLTHPCLDMCSAADAASELSRSRDLLSDWLGHRVVSMAYPNGNVNADVVRAAQGAGYEIGFLFDHRLAADTRDRPLEISRVRVDSTTTMERFRAIASGVHPMIHHLLGRN